MHKTSKERGKMATIFECCPPNDLLVIRHVTDMTPDFVVIH